MLPPGSGASRLLTADGSTGLEGGPYLPFPAPWNSLEVFMDLYFTDSSLLSAMVPDATDALVALGVRDGVPFVLGAEGRYDARLNGYFRSMPTSGLPSPNSWRAYAMDIVTWARFLRDKRRKGLWQVVRADVDAYYYARCMSGPSDSISRSTWNRNMAALEHLYRWSISEGMMDALPFAFGPPQHPSGSSYNSCDVPRNKARAKAARKSKVRFLSMDQYVRFRDVGLGAPSDAPIERNAAKRLVHRNKAMGDLLVTTGLRIGEGSPICVPELPAPAPQEHHARSVAFDLGEATSKGHKSRTIRIPTRVLKSIREYQRFERTAAVARGRSEGFGISRPIYCRNATHKSVEIASRQSWTRVPFGRLTTEDRQRLVLVDGNGDLIEPLWLWLTETGRPFAPTSWATVFLRASAECSSDGESLDVTPHMLRHTFAVHMLSALIRYQIGSPAIHSLDDGAYKRVLFDPLNQLRLMLGHASIESTYIYLDTVADAQGMIDDALDNFCTLSGMSLGR